MSYKLLVSKKDIEPYKGGKPQSGAKSGTAKSESSASSKEGSDSPGPSGPSTSTRSQARAVPADATPPVPDEPELKRLSEADLAAAEEAFLRSRQQK
jgi:hypothetical protein